MKKLILILLMGVFLVSCKKKQTIHITAKNAATGEPYPGLTYYVVTYTNINGGTKSKTVATGTLDANGEAVVTERLPKNKGRGVRVVEPENSCYNKNIQLYFSEEDGENFKAEFEFAECAYLTISVNNINCQGLTDNIIFDMQPTYVEGFNNIIPREEMGCYSNTFIESSVPFGQWEATWEVTRNNSTTYHDTTFFMNINEHHLLTINY
ncbi:hypothetical protein [Brumimicrobium oceani]|uniref:Carboxypeptidase regulatory-like domain-containing protein n=1 Tax=Brumimicrobium oceani TaxID=2100725 RepID=A0A2U2XAM8_9FLAO|nr:hypothetical protein [Brumimicrobium oceani]PWH84771.1 hypothetical protein DIT68_12635 [Brumimicrobium oceani]